jgi:photosynthetic reaction center cytochrome c subunit
MGRRWLLVVPAGALLAAVYAAAQGQGESEFKNVQVLKGVAHPELIDAMRHMNQALGVECDFCHVTSPAAQMDRDDKKAKQTARAMISMTLAINKDHFEGHQEISCATCHHGRTRPDRIAPLNYLPARDDSQIQRVQDGPQPAALLAKYVEQLGGADAIAKNTVRVEKGTLTRPDGQSAPFAVTRKGGKYLFTVGTRTFGYNGGEGWVADTAGPTHPPEGAVLDRLRRAAEMFPAVGIEKRYPRVMLMGIGRIGEDAAYVVMARDPNGAAERLYFSKDSGLLLRRVALHRTPVGELADQTDYADYRTVDGVKVPFAVTRQEAGARWVEKYEEVKTGGEVPDSGFEKPAAKH